MSEKEFLKDFLFSMDIDLDESYVDIQINKFLEEHHKEYYEVEFVEKEDNIEIPEDYPVLDATDIFKI